VLLLLLLVTIAAGASLRESRELGSWSPPSSKVIVEISGSIGASIATTQSSFSKAVGTTLCSHAGSNSKKATMQMDHTAQPVVIGGQKIVFFSCPLDFKFPNAVSGDCSCEGKFACIQGPWGWSSWTCSRVTFDCGNNDCIKIRDSGKEFWNANDESEIRVTVEPVDATNPIAPVEYGGPIEVSWVPVASGSSLTLTSSTTFTDTIAKKAATTNTLSIKASGVEFMGIKLEGSAATAVTHDVTRTITSTATKSVTCVAHPCDSTIWQAHYTAFTANKSDSITTAPCIFKCAPERPSCAPFSKCV